MRRVAQHISFLHVIWLDSPHHILCLGKLESILEIWILLNSVGLLAFNLGLVQGQGIDLGASSQEIC